jgi:hypothetical protein
VNTYIFLLPLYNDWESFVILSKDINIQMKNMNKTAEILIINDFSTQKPPSFKPLSNIKHINILNLKKNLGSQKAISIGLKYLKEKNEKMIITILDSDGEDDVSKVSSMISEAEKKTQKVIVSSRTKRQEIFVFQMLYFVHKLLTFIFTFKWISFGNFSSFHSIQLDKILSNNSSWLAFSSSVAKNCVIEKIQAERKKRLIGVSKLSFLRLVFHSLRVNAVFFFRSFIFSSLYVFTLFALYLGGFQWSLYFILFIIFYNILLLLIISINNSKHFSNSLDFLKKN